MSGSTGGRDSPTPRPSFGCAKRSSCATTPLTRSSTLDDRRVADYVEIPEIVRQRTAQNRAKFSDCLRLELLSRHGGVWLDATCLVRGRLLDVVPELLDSGFFAFQHRRARIASWFLVSEPNNPVVAMTREAQYLYWERFEQATDYFVLHHLVESLYYVADEFRERFELTPWHRRARGDALQAGDGRAVRPAALRGDACRFLRAQADVQASPGRPRQGSMLAFLMQEGARA